MASRHLTALFKQLGLAGDLLNAVEFARDSALFNVVSRYKTKVVQQALKKYFRPRVVRSSSVKDHTEKTEPKPSKEQLRIQEEARTREAKQLVKRMERLRQEKELRTHARQAEETKRLEQAFAEEQQAQERQQQLRKDRQRQEFSALTEKIKAKKVEFQKLQVTRPRFPSREAPLFKQLEERYTNEVLLPELERKKAELAKKRSLFQPLDPEELREHARKHDEILKHHKQQRSISVQDASLDSRIYYSSVPRTKYYYSALEEDRRKEREEVEKQEYKRKLLQKKQHYAELVKEVYQPVIDPLKQKEMELIKERSKHPARPPPRQNSWSNSSAAASVTSSIATKPRKWKKNSMIPDTPPKREPKVVDYLSERRKLRTETKIDEWEEINMQEGLTQEERQNRLKAVAERLEYKARMQEIKTSNLKDTVESGGQAASLMLTAIKAKLAALDTAVS